jgi:ubiquinone/menaquinone biosynthesis C-methylase UbiE
MLNFVENQQDQTFDFVIAVASFQHIPTRWERLLILKHIYRILSYE